MSKFGSARTIRYVCLCSLTACIFVHFAANVIPVGIWLVMSNQIGKHDMDELNIACSLV